MSYRRTQGSLAYVRILDPKRRNLSCRAYECVIIGYFESSKAYRFYDLDNKVIIESNDEDFFEDKFPFKSRNSGSLVNQTSKGSNSSSLSSVRIQSPNNELDPEPRRSKRVRIANNFREDFEMYNVKEDPKDLTKAFFSVDANLWQEAINDEIDSLESNRTWHLVDLA